MDEVHPQRHGQASGYPGRRHKRASHDDQQDERLITVMCIDFRRQAGNRRIHFFLRGQHG